jgi:nucleoside-diphosphate-sugar epimerase
VTEGSSVVTTEYDAANEYLAEDYFRAYARTKLLGERRVTLLGTDVDWVIVRPTVIVDLPEIIAARNWSLARKILFGYRQTHHIYVRDFVHAILWLMRRSLNSEGVQFRGEVFNLSNDDVDNTYADFLRKAFNATRDKRFFCPPCVPGLLDNLRVMAKYRSREWRYPLGMLRYAPEKLYAKGYRHQYGIMKAQELAIDSVRDSVESNCGIAQT